MNAKISVSVISVEAMIYFLLYNLYDCTFNQGGLTKKNIELNLCNIFSIFIFNELYLFV